MRVRFQPNALPSSIRIPYSVPPRMRHPLARRAASAVPSRRGWLERVMRQPFTSPMESSQSTGACAVFSAAAPLMQAASVAACEKSGRPAW